MVLLNVIKVRYLPGGVITCPPCRYIYPTLNTHPTYLPIPIYPNLSLLISVQPRPLLQGCNHGRSGVSQKVCNETIASLKASINPVVLYSDVSSGRNPTYARQIEKAIASFASFSPPPLPPMPPPQPPQGARPGKEKVVTSCKLHSV